MASNFAATWKKGLQAERTSLCTSNCWPSSQARLRSECSSFTRNCLQVDNMKKSVFEIEDMSPEIALRVVLKLLPVEPVLIRPHPDSNLWDGVFSHFCLFVCYFPAPQVSAGGNSGGKHSQPGSSLHKQSHTLPPFVFSRTKQQSAVVFCDLHPSAALLTDHGNLTEGRASCAIFICF